MTVLPSSEVRKSFPAVLRRFRDGGADAEPVVFGSHRKPEAVIIPFALYDAIYPLLEDIEVAALIRERTSQGSPEPLDDVAAELGVDLEAP